MEKLDCKSLMIGDWVNVMKKDSYEPVRVCTIYENAIDYLYIDNSLSTETTALGMITIAGVEPILITPEILEKNGFKPTGSQYIIYNDYYDILMFELSDSIWELQYTDFEFGISNAQISFSYVHQLQHVLRLCGIEKEIQI